MLCPSFPSSLGEVSVITLIALILIIFDPLTFFVALIAVIFTALAIADRQCLLLTANARPPAACLSSADSAAAAASCPPAEPLLPLVALFFIMADCYVVVSAPAPSSHCCSHRHCFHRIVIVTAPLHTYGGILSEEEKGRKRQFSFTAQQIEKSESESSF
jgi:hypothetical protein